MAGLKPGFCVIDVTSRGALIREMARMGVDPRGIEIMAPKGEALAVRLEGLPKEVALLLKQEMLSKGGDVALPKEAIRPGHREVDALLIGTRKQFEALLSKLRSQPGLLPGLVEAIEGALRSAGPRRLVIEANGRRLVFGERTLVMGIINATPDSFSGDGVYKNVDAALRRAEEMIEAGADIIDVGGESTRPGADPVPEEEERERVIPVVEAVVRRFDVPVSVDTYKARVAEEALDKGAWMVNDVTALRGDKRMGEVVARYGAPVVLMHMKGTPKTMQENPQYEDVVAEQLGFFRERMEAAVEAGVEEGRIIIDPGIGFGKRLEHNLEILRRLSEYRSLGRPVLIGPSRKSFIGMILGGLPPEERLEGTLAVLALAVAKGVDLVRVHDVKEAVRAIRVAEALERWPLPI